MDNKIKNYADAIYQHVLTESAATINTNRTNYLRDAAARNTPSLPLAGPQIHAILGFYVEHIERCMTGRLDSYQKAFLEVGRDPTDQDFREILNEFDGVRQLQVTHSSAAVASLLVARGAPGHVDPKATLLARSAQGRDRVFRSWKIWQGRVGLHPVVTTAASAKSGWAQLRQILWSWPAAGGAGLLLIGLAGNAIYAGDLLGTGTLCFFGISLIAAKFLSWDKTQNFPRGVSYAVIAAAILSLLGMLAWARARSPRPPAPPLITMQISPSVFPISIPSHSVTSVLQLHPYIGLTDKQDGLLKVANDTGKDGCWPSQKEMDSMGPHGHESVYHVEIGNHSQRTVTSGRVIFGLKYQPGQRGGSCMPPSGAKFDQEDVVLIPPLDPGKAFDFYAVNQSNQCVWLIPPGSAIVRMEGDEKENDVLLTFDKNPLYKFGAPAFSATMIEWEGVPIKPNGYGIVRTGSRVCKEDSTAP